ncbi:MAG TPA: hypothetical protein VGV13_03100 [Methylomirabilota bacterium]|jgi:hypothetical protein|nr:hypothetical protein [Methylomirabilota bacterium]
MKVHVGARLFAFVMAAVFVASQAAAQVQGPPSQTPGPEPRRGAPAALVLPVVGKADATSGQTFRGTLSVQRFASRTNADGSPQAVAVAMITGTVVDANGTPLSSFLKGPVEIPVTVSQRVSTGLAPSGQAARPVGEAEPLAPPDDVILAQETCGVLNLELGPIPLVLDVLGAIVNFTTGPISLDISGETGGTNLLGTLVCRILGTLTGAVENVVGLLNQLLGVLGGLTGGLTI